MILDRIKLYQFQNYQQEDILFHEKLNVITGLNGMGKTNLLDSIYYLCLGKSYFKSYDRHVVQQGTEGFRVEGHVARGEKKDKLVIKVVPGSSKEIILSGDKTTKIMDHIGRFPSVIVAPIDVQLMLEGSSERRRFINNTLIQYDKTYADCTIRYNKLLKHRNAQLKSFIEQRQFDPHLLESITHQMIAPAQYIYEKRKEMLAELRTLFTKNYKEISGNHEVSSITYKSSLHKHDFKELLSANIEKDRIMGRTTDGIHRDDITFRMDKHPLKNFSSQGQLKSFVLALKLAQYELLNRTKDVMPILLLDDIFDKLDRSRVAHLLDMISGERFGQVFISDTNYDRVPNLLTELNKKYKVYNVSYGKIVEANV